MRQKWLFGITVASLQKLSNRIFNLKKSWIIVVFSAQDQVKFHGNSFINQGAIPAFPTSWITANYCTGLKVQAQLTYAGFSFSTSVLILCLYIDIVPTHLNYKVFGLPASCLFLLLFFLTVWWWWNCKQLSPITFPVFASRCSHCSQSCILLSSAPIHVPSSAQAGAVRAVIPFIVIWRVWRTSSDLAPDLFPSADLDNLQCNEFKIAHCQAPELVDSAAR